jgi:hypothetical protein
MAWAFLRVYFDQIESWEALSDAERGRLLLAALKYAARGEPPEFNGNERYQWPQVRSQIDKEKQSYLQKVKQCSDAGKASAESRGNYQRPSTTVNDRQRPLAKEQEQKQEQEQEQRNREKKADAFREFAGENADLLRALREFSEMRTRIKAPLTDAAKTRLLSRLRTFPAAEWIPILDQSVDNCWKDIYALKKDEQPQPRRTSGRNVQTTPAPTVSDQVKKYGPINDKMSAVLAAMPGIGGDL